MVEFQSYQKSNTSQNLAPDWQIFLTYVFVLICLDVASFVHFLLHMQTQSMCTSSKLASPFSSHWAPDSINILNILWLSLEQRRGIEEYVRSTEHFSGEHKKSE